MSQPFKHKTGSHFINGEWVQGQGAAFTSVNPADGSFIWQGTHATEADIQAACDAAHRALAGWSGLVFAKRAAYMQGFAEQIESKRQELTLLIARETGKPLWEAATEVSSVIAKIKLSIQSYQERTAEKRMDNADASSCLRYKPHGVVAVLGPFNFPAHISNGHIVPALLAGNTLIYKPSELTPAVAEFVVQTWQDSGLPAGVLNLIQGGASCAKSLLQQDLQGVYFTGSYKTGLQINKQFSDRPEIILALEMGGNNPLIIDQVKNTEAAVYQTLLSTFITAGQRCTCARRILVPDNEAGDHFLEQLIKACKKLVVAEYSHEPEPFMGPVISHEHALAHLQAFQALKQAGGQLLLPMSLLAEGTGLLSPGIIDMTQVKQPADEEIFAPLAQIYRYQDFEQALSLANQTRYGLAAGLFSDNADHYQQFYQTIRAGLINWNRPTTGAASNLPFGGIGRSGNHRPSAYFAADYCAYPIASLEQANLTMPAQKLPGT